MNKNIYHNKTMAHGPKRENRLMAHKTWTKKKRQGGGTFNKFSIARLTHKKRGQKGQSLIEALILSLGFIILIQSTLLIFWVGINILWMEHQLYQGLLCTAEQRNIHLCRAEVVQQIKRFNPAGRLSSLKINHFQNEWKGEIIWNFYKKNFLIRQSLSLPK